MWVHPVTLVIGMIINERDHHVGGRVRPAHTHKHTYRVVYYGVSIAMCGGLVWGWWWVDDRGCRAETGRFGRFVALKILRETAETRRVFSEAL